MAGSSVAALHMSPVPSPLRRAYHAHFSNPFLSAPRSLPLLQSTPPLRHHHLPSSSSLIIRHRCRLKPCSALDADVPTPLHKGSESFQQWDSMTAKFAGASNIPFLLLQLPQIILNARNLLAGNNAALFAVPWLEYIFPEDRPRLLLLQKIIRIIITQLAMAGAMPLPHFSVTSIVVACGLVTNFMYYYNFLSPSIWEDFITVAGLSALPQVMWSTFVPYLPNSVLPGEIAFAIAMTAVVMARMRRLSEKGIKFVGSISGWTATLLFMWMPVAQMWTNFLNPDNIKGLSSVSMLLAMMGNGLMIPRALFIRDLMWFTGSSWASVFYGWGNLICMYCFKSISKEFFLAATIGLFLWIAIALWNDTKVYGYSSPLKSIKELISGS